MNENISFYRFMHKQILVAIALFIGTAPGYILMGALYGSAEVETAWVIFIIIVSLYGYKLYKDFSPFMTIEQKDFWLNRVQFFMFAYFSLWSIIFLVYV
ncbi:MAG: hypothetical protein Q9M40_05295 [Sulfurimonas sp.]|nr:hypothetical protein [Sulfurimonas sp.]